jgi:hypothetical protein
MLPLANLDKMEDPRRSGTANQHYWYQVTISENKPNGNSEDLIRETFFCEAPAIDIPSKYGQYLYNSKYNVIICTTEIGFISEEYPLFHGILQRSLNNIQAGIQLLSKKGADFYETAPRILTCRNTGLKISYTECLDLDTDLTERALILKAYSTSSSCLTRHLTIAYDYDIYGADAAIRILDLKINDIIQFLLEIEHSYSIENKEFIENGKGVATFFIPTSKSDELLVVQRALSSTYLKKFRLVEIDKLFDPTSTLFDAIINLKSHSENFFLEEKDLLYIQQNGKRLWGIPLYNLSEIGFKKSNGFYELYQLAQEGNELGIKEDLFSLFIDNKDKEAYINSETFGLLELRDVVSWLITNESTSSFWEYIGVLKDQSPLAFLKEKGILLA